MPTHIAFLLPNLGGGGAERLTVDLMSGFLARGSKVDLLLMQAQGPFLRSLPDQVNVIDLKADRVRRVFRPLRNYIIESRPDGLVAAMWPLTTIATLAIMLLRKPPRLLLADHCALREQYSGSLAKTALLHASIYMSYRFADSIVGVSDGVSDELSSLSGLDRSKVTTIYNPIPPPKRSLRKRAANWGASSGKRILAVGSLKPQKNFPLLLHAFAQLLVRMDATLAIVGDGSERLKLANLVNDLGLQSRVLLPGFSDYPGDWYASADLFVSSSDYEGFALVLGEALHFGIPVVATDCPHGSAEMLGGGRWGWLVPRGDVKALAESMERALSSAPDARNRRGRAAEFSVERAIDSYWSKLFPQ